jgi:subfamily B ATP-binding cassette protein MsbA
MFYRNWRFTLISLSVAPILFAVVYLFTRHIRKRRGSSKEGKRTGVHSSGSVLVHTSSEAFTREDYEGGASASSLDNVETALRAQSLKMKLFLWLKSSRRWEPV